MKFSIAPLCLLVSTFLFATTSAYKHDPNNIVIKNEGNLTTITFLPTPMDDYDFTATSISSFSKNMSATPLKFPVKADDAFILDVMENVKADMNTQVFGTILGSVSTHYCIHNMFLLLIRIHSSVEKLLVHSRLLPPSSVV
jgi:hypothetical protein